MYNYNNLVFEIIIYDYIFFQDILIEDILIIDIVYVELLDGSNCSFVVDGFCDILLDYLV